MIRNLLVAGLLTTLASPAAAAPLLGDFECLSNRQGPETYEGTLRIEETTRFGFLTAQATVDAWHPLDLTDPDSVIFDNAFVDHISPGATVVSARVLADEFAYSVVIRTRKGAELPIYCLYVY